MIKVAVTDSWVLCIPQSTQLTNIENFCSRNFQSKMYTFWCFDVIPFSSENQEMCNSITFYPIKCKIFWEVIEETSNTSVMLKHVPIIRNFATFNVQLLFWILLLSQHHHNLTSSIIQWWTYNAMSFSWKKWEWQYFERSRLFSKNFKGKQSKTCISISIRC